MSSDTRNNGIKFTSKPNYLVRHLTRWFYFSHFIVSVFHLTWLMVGAWVWDRRLGPGREGGCSLLILLSCQMFCHQHPTLSHTLHSLAHPHIPGHNDISHSEDEEIVWDEQLVAGNTGNLCLICRVVSYILSISPETRAGGERMLWHVTTFFSLTSWHPDTDI